MGYTVQVVRVNVIGFKLVSYVVYAVGPALMFLKISVNLQEKVILQGDCIAFHVQKSQLY